LAKAGDFVSDVASRGGNILFVGTKRQVKQVVGAAAQSCGMPYINVRWLGGTFTNFRTIQKTFRKLEKLIDLKSSGKLETQYTKKERLLVEREVIKLEKLFEGIKTLKRIPDAIFISDINRDDIALIEAIKTKVPVIALVDSNSDPSKVDYPIPCNDDATKAVELISNALAERILEGKAKMTVAPIKELEKVENN
jgi:small subunit ribosomal protein S2